MKQRKHGQFHKFAKSLCAVILAGAICLALSAHGMDIHAADAAAMAVAAEDATVTKAVATDMTVTAVAAKVKATVVAAATKI